MSETMGILTPIVNYQTNTQKELVPQISGTGISDEYIEWIDLCHFQVSEKQDETELVRGFRRSVLEDYSNAYNHAVSGITTINDISNTHGHWLAFNFGDELSKRNHSIEISDFVNSRNKHNRQSWLPLISNLAERVYLSPSSPYHDGVEPIVARIVSFKYLEKDWDGYGAIPPNAEVTALAISLIYRLEDLIWQLKDYYPNPHGTITLEWHVDEDKELVIEIGSKKVSYFYEKEDGKLNTGVYTSLDIATTVINSILDSK
jgi:hypothetical protein